MASDHPLQPDRPGEAVEDAGNQPEPPSGWQFRISHADQEVVVTEVGATLRSYMVAGVPVLEGFAESEICPDGRGQILVPWPARLGDGRYRFRGREYQLPLDDVEFGNAIHGFTRWANWVPVQHSTGRLVMRQRLNARPGYPFRLDLSASFELDDAGLSVSLAAVNTGRDPAPFGAGAHPYLTVGTALVDSCRLRVPAATFLVTDARLLPAGRIPVTGTEWDFREGRLIGGTRLGTAYTDLARDGDGRARATLEAPGGRRLVLWVDQAHRWLQLYSGEAIPAPHRRTSLAMEPMTCPPDAFRSGEDLTVLEPGERLIASWGIDVTGFRG
jgi:galactose mutarotase-like enzyme